MKRLVVITLTTGLLSCILSCSSLNKQENTGNNRFLRDNFVGIHGNGMGEFTNKSVDLADKLWQKYADDNDNAFYYRHEYWYDSIYVWTYRAIDDRNFLTISFISPQAETYSITYNYPYSIEWVYTESFDAFTDSLRKNGPFSYGMRTGWAEFEFLSRTKHLGGISLPMPDLPEYVDTIPVLFMKNYMRDFNNCIKPFMDMRITTHKAGDYYINPEENIK